MARARRRARAARRGAASSAKPVRRVGSLAAHCRPWPARCPLQPSCAATPEGSQPARAHTQFMRGRPGATALLLPSPAHCAPRPTASPGPPPPPHLAVGVWQPHRRRGRPLPPGAVGGRARVQHAHGGAEHLRMSGRAGLRVTLTQPYHVQRLCDQLRCCPAAQPCCAGASVCTSRARTLRSNRRFHPVCYIRMARQHTQLL